MRTLAQYVRGTRTLRLKEAIHKMTGASANHLNLQDRGVLRAGAAADVVVLSPESVADGAMFREGRRPPEGIEHVLVNGQTVVEQGQYLGSAYGTVLMPLQAERSCLMSYYPQLGMSVHDLDTPALLLDLEAFQFNLQTMASFFAGKACRLRPHIKTHKCPTIALKQLEAGAIGITCAKVSEAEVMASAGVQDILIANQVTGTVKLDRLTDLAQRCSVTVAADDADNVRALEQACSAKNVRLKALIEVDVGMRRCGVPSGAPAVQLARQIADSSHLTFMGLQAYEGHLVLTADPQERAVKVRAAFEPVRETCELLERAGLPACIVSGGGTGTYDITGNLPPVNEVQAGSYVFMDCTYRKVRPEFKPALSVLTTVVSRSIQGGLVVDAGLKAMTKEFGWPQPVGIEGASVRYLSEEHGVLDLSEPERVSARPGDKTSFIPSHCCTTVNLHDQLHVIQNGVLVDIWPIAARGHAQ